MQTISNGFVWAYVLYLFSWAITIVRVSYVVWGVRQANPRRQARFCLLQNTFI
jgi:hypothetical protein